MNDFLPTGLPTESSEAEKRKREELEVIEKMWWRRADSNRGPRDYETPEPDFEILRVGFRQTLSILKGFVPRFVPSRQIGPENSIPGPVLRDLGFQIGPHRKESRNSRAAINGVQLVAR